MDSIEDKCREACIEYNNTLQGSIKLQRQYRGLLIARKEDYEHVSITNNAYCVLTALGSGYSTWYLYNYEDQLMVVIRDMHNSYSARKAPKKEQFDLINDGEF